MFYYVNPTYRYQFFSPDSEEAPVVNGSTDEPKRNLVNALISLYEAYGGKAELNNNAVDIIYKIAEVIAQTNNASDAPIVSTNPNPKG